MDSHQVIEALRGAVPEGAVEVAPAADGMPAIYVAREHAVAVCTALRDLPALQFAFAPDITAVDYMPREPRFEVMMHLVSLGVAGFGDTPKRLRVKVRVPGADPIVSSVASVWPAAGWSEREAYDLFGIQFTNHPDLRRILMPDDWEGFPLRKDYPVQIKQPVKTYEPLQVSQEQFVANIEATRDRARNE